MPLQEGIASIGPTEYPNVVDVWEASVRATHPFVAGADVAICRPLVRAVPPRLDALLSVRADDGTLAGFIGVAGNVVEVAPYPSHLARPRWWWTTARLN